MTILKKLKDQILETIFHYLSPENIEIFLFGSHAENTASKRSDIDIGIFSKDNISDAVFLSLCDALNLEVDTLKKIDLVDFNTADASFKEFALKKVELWHTAKNLSENLPI
jgi:predicted nucleotidyltransferase